MSVTLIGIRNSSIKITDDLNIPIIKAIVDVDSVPTKTEMNNLLREVYSKCDGCVSICTFFPGSRLSIQSMTNGTYGTTTGFSLQVTLGTYQNNKFCQRLLLRYNNSIVSDNTVYTGYSSFETVYSVIFVDRNNNIRSFISSAIASIYILYGSEPGVTNYNDKFTIAPIWTGSRYRDNSNISQLSTNTIGNIDPYIINELDPENNDPYTPGGESSAGGGTGDFDNTGDDIDFPSLPSLGATDTGFISLFNPTLQELKDLANYMWSSSFDIALYKKIFTDPMDCILGLSIVPVSVPDGGRGFISVGNMATPIWMNRAGAQYIEVDCGSINVNEYWGSYLDYSPYTKAEIFLPYCGIHPISVDDIMGKSVAVKYHIDILSGACCAYVKCGNAVMYTFIGQCASSIPITGSDWTNVINGILTAAVSVGTMVATGGFSAPSAVSKAGLAGVYTAGHMIGTGSSIAQDVMSMKPQVERSGAISGTGAMLAIQIPYLILSRPKQALPSIQNTYLGYPSFITASLGSLSGYTEIENVHLHDIPATSEELSEIENLLKSGIIL